MSSSASNLTFALPAEKLTRPPFLDALASLKTMVDSDSVINVFNISRLQSIREYCRLLQSVTECYRALESVTECKRVLQKVTERYRVLQNVEECYRV